MVGVKVIMSQKFMILLMDFIKHNGRWNIIALRSLSGDNHVTGGDFSKIGVLPAYKNEERSSLQKLVLNTKSNFKHIYISEP